MSAFACPGAGQFMQRRPLAGACFLAAFLLCLALLVWDGLVPWLRALVEALDFADGRGAPGPDLSWAARMRPVLTWAGLALLVYVANMADAGLAHRRLMRSWNRARAGIPDVSGE